jgi:hypothetical protein
MNERIRELAEQAGFYVAGGKIYIPSTSEEITTCQKKFAELIVNECAEINKQELAFNAFERLMNKYQDHFGVEE